MDHLFAVKFCWLIPLLPLVGAGVSGLFGARWLKQQSHWPIWVTVGASAVLSFCLLAGAIGQLAKAPASHEASDRGIPHGWAHAGSVSATRTLYTWIETGNPASPPGYNHFQAKVSFFIDPLSVTMLCVVTGIGLLICIFSKGYMQGEEGYFRFFAFLGLFIFAMTMLVMGDNFLLLYLGWEGVGLCSYLLIGYYYQRPAAREAAKKAFLVNRVGDFGFALGIMLIFVTFGTITFFGSPEQPGALVQAAVPHALDGWRESARWAIPFLLMVGAFGKSAQFPLYVWLPDAMEGPTPVSALIHAATMVTAGVYMIVRCGTLFVANQDAMNTIVAVGIFTALFAATIALRQFDLKKVFAYSTISQLGFMFAGVGALAPVAGIFHLVTHAFFKALLFLASGVVMHAMLGHLDMRRMSGLKRVMPWTNILMLIGCLALAGFPFFSGFFSKDEIVAAAWVRQPVLGALLLVTAFLTAYYTFRLYFRVFHGPLLVPDSPAEGHAPDDGATDEHAHDTHGSGIDKAPAHGHSGGHSREPAIMIAPLVILALGAIFAGYLNWPEREASLGNFLGHSPSLRASLALASSDYGFGAQRVPPGPFGSEELSPSAELQRTTYSLHLNLMIASGLIAIMGIYLAYLLHLKYRQKGDELAARFPNVSRVLEAKYWVDEVYQAGIVEPLRATGRLFFRFDWVIDGLVWLVGFVAQASGLAVKLTTQRGSLQGYAALMLAAVAIILLLVFW